MNITELAAIVLQEIDNALAMAEKATPEPWIAEDNWVGKNNSAVATTCHHAHDADAAFIAASRTLLPASLRCLKTAIEWALTMAANGQVGEGLIATLCDQWEESK